MKQSGWTGSKARVVARVALVLTFAIPMPIASVEPEAQPDPRAAVSSPVTRAAESVFEYWTLERMAKAQPLDVALDSDPTRGNARQTTDRAEAADGPAASVPGNLPGQQPSINSTFGEDEVESLAVLAGRGPAAPAVTFFNYPYPFTRSGVSPLGLYSQYPWMTNGKLFFTIPGRGNFVCSGTSTTSGPEGNRRLVWAAGHCVNSGGNGTTNGIWATNVLFCPGYAGTGAPFGCWSALELWTVEAWACCSNLKYDQGVIVTSDTSNIGFGRLGDTVGAAGLAWNQARIQNFWDFGYPAASPFSGRRLFLCTAALARTDNPGGSGPETNGIGCDMTGGSSGGGWLIGFNMCCNGYLNSVNSYKYTSQPLAMYGPYFGAATENLYNATRQRFP